MPHKNNAQLEIPKEKTYCLMWWWTEDDPENRRYEETKKGKEIFFHKVSMRNFISLVVPKETYLHHDLKENEIMGIQVSSAKIK